MEAPAAFSGLEHHFPLIYGPEASAPGQFWVAPKFPHYNLSQGHYVGQMTGTDHGYEYFTMLLSQRFLAIPFGDA